jgi:replicative DNA helicase
MIVLKDVPAERAVLAGIVQYGVQSYLDVADLVQESTFTVDFNKIAFTCLKQLFKHEIETVDLSSILSAANEIGLSNTFESTAFQNHIRSLFNFPISQTNVRRLAAKIRKLEITGLLIKQLGLASSELQTINGDETLAHILGIAENAIFDFSSLLNDSDEGPKNISEGLVDYIEYLATHPLDQVGISTNFPIWDASIGGGLRKGTLNLIGARSGVGKSIIGTNIGFHIAEHHQIPVLNMDTEMVYEDHLHRLLAMASESLIKDIETGQFVNNPQSARKVKEVGANIQNKKIPYHHLSINGMPFEDQLSNLRRWIMKDVGLDGAGKANPCVIVYDYLKLMSSDGINGALQEYQLLGFMMTGLHNFAVRYGIPILMLLQLNRDGIDKESTAAASGSDRIIWLCSNFTIFKEKGQEELDADGANGTHKLVVLKARHGQGRNQLDYINCFFRGNMAKVVEGKNNFAVQKEKKQQEEEINEDS